MGTGLGLGSGLTCYVAGGGSVNPNLLTWTEQFQNPAWAKTSAVVTPDASTDPLGGSTADRIDFVSPAGTVTQASSVVATSGGANAAKAPGSASQRFSLSAAFDTGVYVFSIWLRDPGANGYSVGMVLFVSGGTIACRLRDLGDQATFYAWGAKLEVGSIPTGDETNYGARTT